MISQSSRYVYVGEVGIKTLFNRFTPPKASKLFEDIQEAFQRKKTDVYEHGERKVSIIEVLRDGDIFTVLFRLTDPDIPDRILEDDKKQSLRVAARKKGEVPAVSAHLVINVASKFDAAAAYPAAFENVDYLSKTYMVKLLNQICTALFTEERELGDKKKKQTFSPRVEFRGHKSQTIRSVLNSGGRLHGVQFVTNKVVEDEFGDPAYSVQKYQEMRLKITGGPTGTKAIDYFTNQISKLMKQGLESARIVIEDQSGKTKTSKVDLRKQDIASNFFISQKMLSGFKTPLAVCEAKIRKDMVSKMKGVLPR